MKKIIIGILIGIFLCVSFFEILHRTVEVDGWKMCGEIYDKLTQQWHGDFVYSLKVTYKMFALPVKTIYICLSEQDKIAVSWGIGKDVCFGEWKFKEIK